MNNCQDANAWFAKAKQEAINFAAETKAPVIGYAYMGEHTSGCGYFRTDRSAKFAYGTEIPPTVKGHSRQNLEPQAAKLRRMVAQMQKRGIRTEIYEIGGQTA